MNFLKTSFYTSISTGVKILSGLIINKVIAINIGPSGLALIGQLKDFVDSMLQFASGGTSQGVIKYVAQFKEQKSSLRNTISTGLVFCLLFSVLGSLFLFLFKSHLSELLFGNNNYTNVFSVFGLTIFLYSINLFLLSIINGLKEIKIYVKINIISSLLGLILTIFLIYLYQLEGAMYALVLNQSIVVFITVYYLSSIKSLNLSYFLEGFHLKEARNLAKFSVMSLVAASSIPIALIVIRNFIGQHLSWEEAGLWEGVWRVSTMYLLVLTTAFGVYLLPTFSEITDKKKLREELFNAIKYAFVIALILASMIFILRKQIIVILFSSEFLPMSNLFFYQLIGDLVKIVSWIFGNLLIAKAQLLPFISIQIVFSSSLVFLSIFFVQKFGLIGVTMAYLINYLCHFIYMNIHFRNLILSR